MKKSSSDIEKEIFVEEEEEEQALMSSENKDHRDVEDGSKISEKTSGGRTYVFFSPKLLFLRYARNHLVFQVHCKPSDCVAKTSMYHNASNSDLCGKRSNGDVGEQFVERIERVYVLRRGLWQFYKSGEFE